MKIDAVMKKLEKFHGKSKEIKVKNDDGEDIVFKIYQLPMKYMPLFTKIQMFNQKLGIKEPEKGEERQDPDLSLLNKEELTEYANSMKDLVLTSLAFSICVDEGLITYNDVEKGMPADVVDKVKGGVELMGLSFVNRFAEAIFEQSAMEDEEGGDSKKSSGKSERK